MGLGERLLIARRRKHMSQQALARAVGVNKATIYRIETGRSADIPVGTLRKIALELQVSTDWLLGLTQDEEDEVDENPPPAKLRHVSAWPPRDG